MDVLLPSALRTPGASPYNGAAFGRAGRDTSGIEMFVDVSAIVGTSLVVKLQAQDPVSLLWVDVPGAVTAAITTVSTTRLVVYPGVTVVANAAVSGPAPDRYRAVATLTAGTSATFSVSVAELF